MLGLFGTLNLATRSLSTQREGIEVAGHNLANVNNPAYARQRLSLTTSVAIPDTLGPQGSGVESAGIFQIRNALLDRQILDETSVLGSLQAQQRALEYGQANLGQVIDRQTTGAEGAASSGGVGGQHGIAEELANLFNSFQSLSTNPTSTSERQVLLLKAETVASQFNQVDSRLGSLNSLLNDSVKTETSTVNRILGDISKLNQQVAAVEVGGGLANDLRDVRQQRLEELGQYVNFTAVDRSGGAVDIVIGGTAMTDGATVLEQLESYDAGGGRELLRIKSSGAAVNLSGGSIQGTIEGRDGSLKTLREQVNLLASTLITTVNEVHSSGYGLNGTTGQAFFTGTNAGDIGVNSVLTDDPAKIQAASSADAPGNNDKILELAQLGKKPLAALGSLTFSDYYGQTVARLGQSLSSITGQLGNQQTVTDMLSRQRDSYSGVSLDEEMTDLIRYQKAYEASARLVSIIDSMLDVVMSMKR